jgi:hypothetical protein
MIRFGALVQGRQHVNRDFPVDRKLIQGRIVIYLLLMSYIALQWGTPTSDDGD